METVGKLDENDPDVVRHGQEHLAEIFRLALLFGLEVYFADLGNTVNEIGHFRAENSFQLLMGGKSILHRVMEQAGYHRCHVKLEIRQYPRHFHGMDQVRFSGQAGLPLMDFGAKDIRLADQVQVGCGVIGGNLFQNVV